MASVLYHDAYWYPTHQRYVNELLQSPWGRLFANWEDLELDPADLETTGWPDPGAAPARLNPETASMVLRSLRILASCMKEAPEFEARRRRRRS